MSSTDTDQGTRPEYNPTLFVIALSVIYLFIYAVGSYLPKSLWGANLFYYTSVTQEIIVMASAILAAAVMMIAADKVRVPKAVQLIFVYLLAPAALLALFYHFAVANHFLGDGILRSRELETGFRVLPTEPLGEYTNYLVYRVLHSAFGLTAIQSIGVISYASGLLYYYALLPLVGELSQNRATRVFYFLLLYFSGTTLLFCDYSETYMLLPALIALFMATGIKAIRGKMTAIIPIAVFLLLVFFHFKSLIFAPSILVLAYYLHKRGRRYVWPAVIVAMLVVVAAIVLVPLISKLPRIPLTHFLFGFGDKGDNYQFFSMQHFADIYSELMLTGGVALILFLGLISLRRFRNSFRSPEVLFVAGSAPGALAMLVFLYSDLGYAVDWDLFSAVGLTLSILAVVALAMSTDLKLGQVARIALVTVGLTSFLSYAVVNSDFDTTVTRQVDLLELYGGNQAAIGFASMGNNLNMLGHPDLAERMWKRSVRIRPHVRIYANLGQLALNRARYKEAEYYLLRAIELDSTVYVLYMNLGLVYSREGDLKKAEPYFKRAKELSPRSANIYHNYAVELVQNKLYERAEKEEREALALDPDFPIYLIGMSSALIGEGKYEEACKYLFQALKTDPGNPRAISNLADAFDSMGQQERASQLLAGFIRNFPNSPYVPLFNRKLAEIKAHRDTSQAQQ